MSVLRRTANEVKEDFWLMGEVIHGDYNRWVNDNTLHSVTNYHLHKALYSGHNDHNYFEIAHTINRQMGMGGGSGYLSSLYNFLDNHDVERIFTRINKEEHLVPLHILLYTLPGVPSIYYGSEFGIEGKKEHHSDRSLRSEISLEDHEDAIVKNPLTKLIAKLGRIHKKNKVFSYGDYKELFLRNRQYAFSRTNGDDLAIITVNSDDSDCEMTIPCGDASKFKGALSNEKVNAHNGHITVNVKANSGEIWIKRHKIV